MSPTSLDPIGGAGLGRFDHHLDVGTSLGAADPQVRRVKWVGRPSPSQRKILAQGVAETHVHRAPYLALTEVGSTARPTLWASDHLLDVARHRIGDHNLGA